MAINILLVDDHAIVRDGLRALLDQESGFHVIGVTGSGDDAVKESIQLMPDLIVMDIALPDIDGIEATRQIHEQCPKIKILILSMYLNSEYVYRALRAGANGYLLKESAGEHLVLAITEVMNGNRYLSEKITDILIDGYLEDGSEPIDKLSKREREVLKYLAEGLKINDIALALSLSPKTVETYRTRIYSKLEINNSVELTKIAMRYGITS